MIVIGIILIFGGLGGLISKSYAGGLAVLALGVVLLVLGIKRKKKTPKPVPQPQPVSQPPVQPQPQQVNRTPVQPQPIPQPPVQPQPAPRPAVKEETHRVAGVSYYQKAIESLGKENPEYDYSKKEIIEEGLEDDKIFQYDFFNLHVDFAFEPENEYDPNAIAILVNGEKIGYVKKGSTAHIRNLIKNGRIQGIDCDITGGKYKYVDSEDGTMDRDTMDYRATLTLYVKEE